MADLFLSSLFDSGPPHLDPALFQKLAPTLEGLRHALLALSKGEGHPFKHLPPGHDVESQVRAQARVLRREAELLVVAGIGGSSLGPKALCLRPGGRVRFLEGLDPETFSARLAEIPWEKAALNIVSKSGDTVETLVNAGLALEALKRRAPDRWRHRVVLTASPGDGRLQKWARREGIATLEIPPHVGGRYSVLTPVGLLPAAFDGVDPKALLSGARLGADKALLLQGAANPALSLALVLATLYSQGKTEVDIWGYGERCTLFGLWAQQLLAESLGRRIEHGGEHRVGPTPLVCRGSEDQHSLLQLFTDGPRNRWVLLVTSDAPGPALGPSVRGFAGLPDRAQNLGAVQDALWQGTLEGLREAGVPAVRYHLGPPGTASLGEAFFVFQAVTLYAAALFEVDPFGEPGIEAGKRHIRECLEKGCPPSARDR
jgi:glucose-6-phosphate isomerase